MVQKINLLANSIWRATLEPYWGSLGQIKLNLQDRKKKPSLEVAISKFQERWPHIQSSENTSPIFIFAAGWRTGSTLLQRLVMSSQNTMIWGEPYSHNNLIENLSQPLRGITDTYPRNIWFLKNQEPKLNELTNSFTANLYPDICHLLKSHTTFLNTLFAEPAREIGFSRWGIKDVRLGIESAIYLKWLFPQAKFIFLYRNPYHAYASFAGSYWYREWPHKPVYTPKQFAQNWRVLTQDFLDKHHLLEGKLLSYEELCNENFDFDDLSRFLDLTIDPSIMQVKVTGNIKQENNSKYFNQRHLKIIKKYVDPLATSLGYEL